MRNTIKNIGDFKNHKSFAVLENKINNERITALGGSKTRQQKLLNGDVEGVEIVWKGDVFDIHKKWKIKENRIFLYGKFFR